MALEFQINLGGNFVEALDKSNRGLGETEKAVHNGTRALEAFEGELGKVRAGALSLNFSAFEDGGHFLQFDLAEGAALALEAIHKLVEGVIDLGREIVKVAGDAEDLNLAIKLDVGEEGGEKVDELAEAFRGSRFSPKAIKEALLPILEESGDEHREQWADLVTAATDVATRRKTGAAGAKGALEALRGIEIQPQRLRGSLKELGIKQKDFFSDLGELLGISAEAAEKQTKAGQVKAQTLLSVALHQIAAREGGALGNATNEGMHTLGAQLERLGNLKETLFERLAGSRGMQAVQGFLDNFITTLEGPIGTDLVAKVGGAFETMFGDLSGPDGLAKMRDVVGGIAHKVGEFVDGFSNAWPEIKADVQACVPIFEELAREIGNIMKALAALPRIGEAIGDFLGDNLDASVNGTVDKRKITEGPRAGFTVSLDEQDRQAALDRAGKGGFLHQLFSSESTLNQEAFDELGKEGEFSKRIPKLASGGIVSSPTLALIGEAGPEAVVPLGDDFGQGGGGVSIREVNITVQGAGADAHELARAVRLELQQLIVEAREGA
jgi:hypothetical protein